MFKPTIDWGANDKSFVPATKSFGYQNQAISGGDRPPSQ
jgi:hypothetical protein